MTWWASGDAKQPTGPQGQELANRPDRRLLGKTRAGTGPAPSQNIIRAQIIIISGTGLVTGLFEYSGTPALGNPPIAYIAAPGVTHDPFGNTLPWTNGGFVSAAGTTFAVLSAATLQLHMSGDTANPQISEAAGAVLSLASGQTAAATNECLLTLNPAAAGAPSFATLFNQLKISGFSATAESLGLFTAGDTVDRLAITSSGAMSWGTGALAADTTLARTSAGVLTIGNTLIVGTILTNKLELATGAAPAAVSGSVIQAADANGFPITRPDSATGDTTIYNEGHFTGFSTTDQLVNSTTFSTVCAGTTVGTGKYRVHAEVTAVQGPNANPNDYRLGFTGTISQVRMKMVSGQDATNMFLATTTSNNGLLASHGWAAGSTYTATFHGIIVTTSSGTLSLQAAMDAAGDTFTVLALSDFHLEPLS